MKKRFTFMGIFLAAVMMSSCGGNLPDGKSGETKEGLADIGPEEDSGGEKETELALWAFPVGDWGNPTSVNNLLAGFHKEYPDIHISAEYLNYDDGDAKILQAVSEGAAPDLVLEGPERLVANWGERGWMVDLADLWESDKAGEIYDSIRTGCRHRNGAYYEFPICMSAHCMAINYDMFREAGALPYIDEENHTWTTEGFIKAVHALAAYGQKNAGIIYCKNQSGDQGTRALVNNLYGGSFTDSAHTVYTIDSEENRKALQLLYDLDGIAFAPDVTALEAIDLFCRKETAMCFCWNVSTEVQQTVNHPELDFEVFPIAFPTDSDAPRLEGGIWGFGIFDTGSEERIEAAKTFIRYITENDAVYTKAVQAAAYWPVRDMGNIYQNDMLMTEYSIFMQYMGEYHQVTPGWAEARTAWWQMLAKIGAGADISDAVKGFPSPE